jgi:hypothetical protein
VTGHVHLKEYCIVTDAVTHVCRHNTVRSSLLGWLSRTAWQQVHAGLWWCMECFFSGLWLAVFRPLELLLYLDCKYNLNRDKIERVSGRVWHSVVILLTRAWRKGIKRHDVLFVVYLTQQSVVENEGRRVIGWWWIMNRKALYVLHRVL